MSQNSSIEWTGATWNPCAGCSPKSPGCARCYALRMAHRLQAMGQEKYAGTTMNGNGRLLWTGRLNLHEQALNQPERWKPTRVFVNSMSDLFHERVPVDFVLRVFDAMQRAPWHRYQVLTKRSERLLELNPLLPWIPSIWMGVSVENADFTSRIDHLRQTGAAVKFLSLEPLLGPLPNLNLAGIDSVIVGGESGPGARPMKPEWVTDIRDQCARAGVPFFFKQWGHLRNDPDPKDPTAKQNGGHSKGGRLLEGRTWDEMPESATQAAVGQYRRDAMDRNGSAIGSRLVLLIDEADAFLEEGGRKELPEPSAAKTEKPGPSAPQCPECGGFLTPESACWVCMTCGFSKCG